jgi:hypothetical protein
MSDCNRSCCSQKKKTTARSKGKKVQGAMACEASKGTSLSFLFELIFFAYFFASLFSLFSLKLVFLL